MGAYMASLTPNIPLLAQVKNAGDSGKNLEARNPSP